MKNSTDTIGNWFVAQCLNQLRYRVSGKNHVQNNKIILARLRYFTEYMNKILKRILNPDQSQFYENDFAAWRK